MRIGRCLARFLASGRDPKVFIHVRCLDLSVISDRPYDCRPPTSVARTDRFRSTDPRNSDSITGTGKHLAPWLTLRGRIRPRLLCSFFFPARRSL